jgi:regulation of enolase protein 1 (concanavalin A-like superfamily)
MRKSFVKLTIATSLLLAFSAIGVSAEILKDFLNLGRVKTGSIEAKGTAGGGDYYTIIGGGNDTWDQIDEMGFAHHEFIGDFDIRVQVVSIEAVGTWSKAGISARESLAEDARRVAQTVSPVGPTTSPDCTSGANTMEFLWRTGIWDVDGENGGNHSYSIGAPPYPNAWIRLVRRGSQFTGYASYDGGATWPNSYTVDSAGFQGGALPQKLFVGLSVSRHPCAASPTCRTVFTNYTERYRDEGQFCLAAAESWGCPKQIHLYFNRPLGAGALDPGNYLVDYGPFTSVSITGVRAGPKPNEVFLDVDNFADPDGNLTEGTDYNVTVTGPVLDTSGNPVDAGCLVRSFKHAAGMEQRLIHVQHNKQQGDLDGYYLNSVAAATGFGAWTEGQVGNLGNSLFEDPMPDNDPISGYGAAIRGVLLAPADGNYRFACSSDDFGRLFLSTDDQPMNKQLIAREPEWNGSRAYGTPDRRSNYTSNDCGGGVLSQINQSCPQPLQLGGRYYLEYLYTEGGGGNNGSATWDAGTGAAFTDGQSPIPEANFVPSRFAYGYVFYKLGCVEILTGPDDSVPVPIGGTATFKVTLDGSPPYEFQWSYKKAAGSWTTVPGARSGVLNIPNIDATWNGAKVKVTVANDCCSVDSREATLNVKLSPVISALSARGNCHQFIVTWNVPVQRIGTYTVLCSNTVTSVTTPITATILGAGATPNEVVVGVTPDLLPDTNVYYVTIANEKSTGGDTQDPNPVVRTFRLNDGYFGPFNILVRRWNFGGLVSIATFLADPRVIANTPDEVITTYAAFETPGGENGGNYGAILSGFLTVPSDGDYRIWTSSDDYSATYIATDADPAHKVQVAYEPQWNNWRAFATCDRRTCGPDGWPQQTQSPAIPLKAGQLVYLEAAYTEGGGGDNYSAFVTVVPYGAPNPGPPANDTPGNLPAAGFLTKRMAPNGTYFTRFCDVSVAVASQTSFINVPVTFTAEPDGTPARAAGVDYYYQWYRGSPPVPIPGATSKSYTLASPTLADNGEVFTVCVSNDFSSACASATLTVRTEPVVLNVTTLNDPNHYYVYWNKPVKLTGSYTITTPGGIFYVGHSYWNGDPTIIQVETDPIPADTTCVVEISGVTDLNDVVQVTNPTNFTFRQGPGRFCTDFETGLPAGTFSSGTTPPAVTSGVLHLTDTSRNGENNFWTIPLGGTMTFQSFKARWRMFLANPNNGGADGMSFNVGLGPFSYTSGAAENGATVGLAVTVDTYDNGGAEVGIAIRWNGTRLALTRAGGGNQADNALLYSSQFENATLEVSAGGFAIFTYKGYTVSAQIPGYTGLAVNRYEFGARTGGAGEDCWIDDVCIRDYTLAPISVSLNAQPPTVPECSRVTLVATATGSPDITYQWYRNNVAIPGANGAVYTTPQLYYPEDDGVTYKVIASNAFSEAEDSATFSIDADTTPPVLLSAGSLVGKAIGLRFSEPLDQSSAENPLNYTVTPPLGAAPGDNIAGVALRPDGITVVLLLSNALAGNFNVTASGVLDACPAENSGTATVGGEIVNPELVSTDIGVPGLDPIPAGTNVVAVDKQIEITVGGSDTWGTADHNHFIYVQRCGDFDISVKVARLDYAATWSKAGIFARLGLELNAPAIGTYCNPTNGANQIESALRSTPGGEMGDWGFQPRPNVLAPEGWNAWVRLTRTKDQVRAWHSTDGANWVLHADSAGGFCGQLPANVYLGIFATPNVGNNGSTTTAWFQDLKISPQVPGCTNTPCGDLAITNDITAGGIVITWPDACCRLQYATELLDSGTVWTTVTGTDPDVVSLAAGRAVVRFNPPAYKFFRLIYP